MKLLVTGGAGYIGGVVVAQLVAAGHDVTVADDLSTGHADTLPPGPKFVRVGIHDIATVLTPDARFDGVLHFAAKIAAGESVQRPELYWHTNVVGSLALLDAVRSAEVPRLVFSSTAAVYGNPVAVPIELAIALGVAGHALLIDCRSLETEPVPIPPGVRILVLDSAVPRALAGSAYNQRRTDCESALRTLRSVDPRLRPYATSPRSCWPRRAGGSRIGNGDGPGTSSARTSGRRPDHRRPGRVRRRSDRRPLPADNRPARQRVDLRAEPGNPICAGPLGRRRTRRPPSP